MRFNNTEKKFELKRRIIDNLRKFVPSKLEEIQDILEGEDEDSWNYEFITCGDEKNKCRKCALDYFLEDLKYIPEITQVGETHAIARLAQAGDIKSRNQLVEGFIRLALKAAKSLFPLGEIEDMVQEACIGLIYAVEKFDIEKNYNFHNYGYKWAWQKASRYVADNGIIRLPVHLMGRIADFVKVNFTLWQKLSREPTDSEIAKEMFTVDSEEIRRELSAEPGFEIEIDHELVDVKFSQKKNEKIERLRELKYIIESQSPISLHNKIGKDNEHLLSDYIEDNTYRPEKSAISSSLKEKLKDAFNNLTDREEKVICLRFGLDDGYRRTLEEVGKEFGVTRERIRQIEAKALKKLRHPNRKRFLKGYKLYPTEDSDVRPSIHLENDRSLLVQIDRIFSRNTIDYWNFLWNSLDGCSIEKIYKGYYMGRNFDLKNNLHHRKRIVQYLQARKPGAKRRKHNKEKNKPILKAKQKNVIAPLVKKEVPPRINRTIQKNGVPPLNKNAPVRATHKSKNPPVNKKVPVGSIRKSRITPLNRKIPYRIDRKDIKFPGKKVFRIESPPDKPKHVISVLDENTIKEMNRICEELFFNYGNKMHISDFCFWIKNTINGIDESEISAGLMRIRESDEMHFQKVVTGYLSSTDSIAMKKGKYIYHRKKWAINYSDDLGETIEAVLEREGNPLHYREIDRIVRNSNANHRNVGDQAVYQCIISNDKFIRTDRGIYGLKKWGIKEWDPEDAVIGFLKEKSTPQWKNIIIRELTGDNSFTERQIVTVLERSHKIEETDYLRYGLMEWNEVEKQGIPEEESDKSVKTDSLWNIDSLICEILEKGDFGEIDRERIKLIFPIVAGMGSVSMFDIVKKLIEEGRYSEIRRLILGRKPSSPISHIMDGTDCCVKCDEPRGCFDYLKRDTLYNRKAYLLTIRNSWAKKLLDEMDEVYVYNRLIKEPLYLRFTVNYRFPFLKRELTELGFIEESHFLYKKNGIYCPFDDVWRFSNSDLKNFNSVTPQSAGEKVSLKEFDQLLEPS